MTAIEISQHGAAVDAHVGDEIVVRLAENATTGYRWVVERVDGPLRVTSSEYLPPTGPGGAPVGAPPGAGGERRIQLRVTSPGTGSVRLGLSRPWESTAIKRFEARVIGAP